jgi:hypothetical protein
MDWNNDGKHDWKDDAIFHNVIESDEKAKPSTRSAGGSNSSAGHGGLISTVVSLAYLSVLLPGDIPINGFTMFIGLICAGVLVVKFLGWLYK